MKSKILASHLILPLFLLAGCSDRPSNVLSEDKMVSLMVDMELSEAYVNSERGSSNQERIEMGERVLKTHGVTHETLDTTLAWYGRNLDQYSKLFDKVDKELQRKKLKYTEIPGEKPREADNIWPYTPHIVISPLSGAEIFSFVVPHPEVEKGGLLNLSWYLPNPSSLKGTLGVDYKDGYSEASVVNLQSKNRSEITLQTDTAKEVARIYGILQLKDKSKLPFYIDSVSIKVEPIDTLNYRSKRRSQKPYYNW